MESLGYPSADVVLIDLIRLIDYWEGKAADARAKAAKNHPKGY